MFFLFNTEFPALGGFDCDSARRLPSHSHSAPKQAVVRASNQGLLLPKVQGAEAAYRVTAWFEGGYYPFLLLSSLNIFIAKDGVPEFVAPSGGERGVCAG